MAAVRSRTAAAALFTPSVTAMVLVPGWRWMAEHDRALTVLTRVEPGGGLVVLDAVDDLAQLFQPHRRAVAVGDDHGPECGRAHQLAGGLQREGALRTDDGAGGQVDVPVAQRGFDFVDADLARGQGVRIHLHVHGVLLAPSTCTCATPLTIEMRWAMRVSAYSSSVHSGSVAEVRAR